MRISASRAARTAFARVLPFAACAAWASSPSRASAEPQEIAPPPPIAPPVTLVPPPPNAGPRNLPPVAPPVSAAPILPPPPVKPLPRPPPAPVMVAQPEPEVPPLRVPPPPPPRPFRIAAGYRLNLVSDPSFDTYSSNDVLSQLSLEITYAAVNTSRAALAVGVAWDFGGRRANAAGFEARMSVSRVTVPVEGRLYLSPWAYVFGRVAPGGAIVNFTIPNPPGPLAGNPWVFASDFSGGASILLFPHGMLERHVARVWLTPEAGYGWTTSAAASLSAREGGALVAGVPQQLDQLALRGAFFRAELALTF